MSFMAIQYNVMHKGDPEEGLQKWKLHKVSEQYIMSSLLNFQLASYLT